ncbi:MAG TPA: antibiotic biosynthesis monooxygenase [Candidatus Dormibacteraeota bacterium]|nr:antibiotic biosynthesis monooxygenase [Candidatus Dormibacteraeota bacterium]
MTRLCTQGVVTLHAQPEKVEDCIRIFRELNAPSIAAQPGFDHGHWWVDRSTGKAVSVTFWDTEGNERASRAHIPRLLKGMADVLATNQGERETFEAVHEQCNVHTGLESAASPRATRDPG